MADPYKHLLDAITTLLRRIEHEQSEITTDASPKLQSNDGQYQPVRPPTQNHLQPMNRKIPEETSCV